MNHFHVQEVLLLIPILLYIIMSLLTANRGELLSWLMAVFVFWYIVSQRNTGWSKRVVIRFIKRAIVFFVVAIAVFWLLAFFMGTADGKVDNDFVLYISNYLAGGISSFNLFLEQGGIKPKWFGEETFVTLNNNISTIFNIDHISIRTLEFRNTRGYAVVNIYSSFRRFYHDFGISGVILLSFIQGYFMTKIYQGVKKKRVKYTVEFAVCFYCFIINRCLFIPIEDSFYSVDISLSGFIRWILFFICYKFIMLNASQEIKYE